MTAIVSFPWYPFKGCQHQFFWDKLRAALEGRGLTDLPEHVDSPEDYRSHWASPDLLLSQCCGYHIASRAHELEVVAAPDFELEGVAPGQYRSVIITNAKSTETSILGFEGKLAAINEDQSFSGWTALLCAIPPQRCRPDFFKEFPTGSHLESMKAVAEGRAEVAAIDKTSYKLILETAEYRELADRIRTFPEATPPAQAPPYVTSPKRDKEEVAILRDELVTLSLTREDVKQDLKTMGIRAIVDATNEDYIPLAEVIKRVEGGGV